MKQESRGRRWPLRLRIMLLLLVSTIVPLGLMGYLDYRHSKESIEQSAIALLTARGDEVAGKLDAFNSLYQMNARHIGETARVARYLAAPADGRAELTDGAQQVIEMWTKADPAIRGAALLDPAGTVLLATEPPLLGEKLGTYGYVREALKGSPVTSEVHVSPANLGDVPSVAYLSPIKDANAQLLGVSVVWVRAKALWQVVAEGNGKAGPQSFSALLDQYGIRIAHSFSEEVMFHPGGQLDSATLEKMVAERRFGDKTRQLLQEPMIVPDHFEISRSATPSMKVFRAYASANKQSNLTVPRRLTTAPWTLFYMIPETSLAEATNRVLREALLLTAGAMIFALVCGLVISRGIVESFRLISRTSEELAACAHDLTASVEEFAASTAETATAVTQTTSMVEEVKQTANLSSQKARNVSERSQHAAEVAREGRQSVAASMEGMDRIESHMGSVADGVISLLERSQAIGEITAIVNGLADQSNLLAVNASIEAARAGEHGKGFSVVAQEIRHLADQSRSATGQIRTILTDIQRATSSAVHVTEQASKVVDEGMKQSAQAGKAIDSLADNVAKAADAAMQIAASSHQQMVGMDQIAIAVDSIRQASAQNAAAARQLEASAHKLNDIGRDLDQLIEKYGFDQKRQS